MGDSFTKIRADDDEVFMRQENIMKQTMNDFKRAHGDMIRLHNDRIAVLPIKQEVSAGGISLPQGSIKREVPVLRGIVVATGPGQYIDGTIERAEMPVAPGDVVHYLASHTVRVTVNEIEFHVIDLSTLICVEV